MSKKDKFICKTFECGQSFSGIYSFKNHLERVHLKKSGSLPPSAEHQQKFSCFSVLSSNIEEQSTPTSVVDMSMTSEFPECEIFNLNKFILALHNKNNLNRKDVFEIVENVQEIILKPIQLYILKSITPLIADLNNRLSVENQLKVLFSSLECSKSEHRFFKSLEKEEILKMPTAFIINEEVCEVILNYEPVLHGNKTVGVLMPLKFQFQKYFESPYILQETLENMNTIQQCQNLNNVMHGEVWKKKTNLMQCQVIIPYVVYIDEFGIDNPLGPHATDQSIFGIYYNFPTIPKHQQSSLNNFFVAGFLKSRDIKDHGNQHAFKPLIKVLQELESDGLHIKTSDKVVHVHFVLALIIGDNLGLNSALGFTTSFNSHFSCRNCKRSKFQTQYDVSEHIDYLRTVENYNSDCNLKSYHLTGVKEPCVFNKLKSFHVVDNLYFDIMHDLFEGVCRYN